MDQLKQLIEDSNFIKWVFKPDAESEEHFSAFFKEHPELEKKYLQIKKELRLISITEKEISYEKGAEIFKAITNQINSSTTRKNSIRKIQGLLRYAAIAVIFFAIGSLFFYFPSRNKTDFKFAEEVFLKNAQTSPVIYFADGSKREIKSAEKYIDLSLNDKLVIGNDTINRNNHSNNTQNSNVLVVPNGQRMQVCLNDKSMIWLNAGSRLVFPPVFNSNKREVYLAGEAFFDIAKNPNKPFFVNTSFMAVKVLGTKFNISSYPDDEEVVTVLEEGKIQIIDTQAGIPSVKAELLPNQLARLTKENNQLEVTNTDYELYTLWKDGLLRFEQEPINQLINKIERYYNIKIILKDSQKGDEKVRGKLDLNASMPKVLEYITKITQTEIIQVNRNTYILE